MIVFKKEFLAALNAASKFTNGTKKSMLAWDRVRIDNGTGTIIGTDLESWCTTEFTDRKSASEEAFCCGPRQLKQLIASEPGEDVVIDFDKKTMTITVGANFKTIPVISDETFPMPPDNPWHMNHRFVVPKENLLSIASLPEDDRKTHYTKAVAFNDIGEVIGTDGTRVHIFQGIKPELQFKQFCLNKKVMRSASALAKENVWVYIPVESDQYCLLSIDSNPPIKIVASIMDCEFPPVNQVFYDNGTDITVERKELMIIVQKAALMSDDEYRGAKVEIKDGRLTMTMTNPERGEFQESFDVLVPKDLSFRAGINPKYCQDAINYISCGAKMTDNMPMTLSVKDNEPFIFQTANARAAVMPMKI